MPVKNTKKPFKQSSDHFNGSKMYLYDLLVNLRNTDIVHC